MEIPPNQTVYVNNLNEKVPKQEVRRSLYALFGQFGPILDVVALKTTRMRGQAFIVFRDISGATSALRSMQGFVFYKKPMRISYAKGKSHAVMKEDGTFGKAKKSKPSAQVATTSKAPAIMDADKPETEMAEVEVEGAPANNILFCSNLPDETTDEMLNMLFEEFPGLTEVRLVPNRADIAFIEFANDSQAAVAMQGLQGFKVDPQHAMSISYAKK